jgi:hypothetical protein
MRLPIYVIEFFGDLEPRPMRAYETLEVALDDLKAEFVSQTPDPEDDRIVVWRFVPGEVGQAVWHFSGWHWDPEARDLSGGPLPQGALPGFRKSLYELALGDQ